MRWLPALVLTACAQAGGTPADLPGDASPRTDGPIEPPPIDAPGPDAMPVPAPLSQNSATTTNGNSFACSQSYTKYTLENSYYRVFPLADYGITGPYEVQSVTFAVQTANAGGTQQPAQVKIGKYNGTPGGISLSLADVAPLNSTSIMINDGVTSVTTPISGVIPAGGNLIVELAIPDGTAAGNIFFIGTNAAGESKPGYIRAPAQGCDFLAPTSMNAVAMQKGLATAYLVMTVSGVKY
jgi:hypothetical protein